MAKKRNNPIILIPGIQGTKLHNVNEADFKVLWSGVKKFFPNIHKLKLKADGRTDQEKDIVIERADIENLAYSEIVNYLRNKGFKVFIFGYDWRKSNKESGAELAHYVELLKTKLRTRSFNFLTHSMGCLVLSAYYKTLSVAEIDRVTNRVIFSVPPFKGSVESVFNLLIGKSKLFNSSDDFRKIARTFPAIYELLPVYKDCYAFEDAQQAKAYNPYDFDTYWQCVPNATRSDTIAKQQLIRNRLKDLGDMRNQNDFIYDLGKLPKSVRDKLLVLAGTNSETMHRVFIQKKMQHIINFFNFEKFKPNKQGDGTVHLDSARVFASKILTLKVKNKWLETWSNSAFIMNDWHAFFLNNGRVQNVITRFFDDNKDLSGKWYDSISGGITKVR